MRGRIVTYWLFGVLIGCLPILFTVQHASTHAKDGVSLTGVLGGGLLLLVSVAVGAPAVGGLFAKSRGDERAKITGGLTLISVLLAAYGFSDATTGGASHFAVAIESLIFFGLIVFLGTLCTAMSADG
jgi:hypothetical protein